MLPILHIGPLAIQTPGLIILLGLWLGLLTSERFSEANKDYLDQVNNLVLIALISTVISARLGYAAKYPQIFMENPSGFLSLNPGLLDPWSGFAGGLIAALIYGKRKGLPFWATLDFLSPAFTIFLISFGLANLASGNGYGKPSDLPWAIELWGANRHPTQLYEALAGFIIIGVILPIKSIGENSIPGIRFLVFLVLFSSAQIFLEAFRGDSVNIYAGIRVTQVIYWAILCIGLWLLGKKIKTGHQQSSSDLKPA